MESQISLRCLCVVGKAMAISIGYTTCLTLACSAHGGIESGIYQTVPGATVLETGDNVTNGSRIVPLSAILTFDLAGVQPSFTAVIHDAVLEGGSPYANQWLGGRQQPFELTVRSPFGARLNDGTYRFTGDYLQDIYPSETQYGFEWSFSTSTNGGVVWKGTTGWWGGHLWLVTISNITLLPVAWLDISRVETTSVQITWATNFADHVLEYATSLPAAAWDSVTNAVAPIGDRLSVTVDVGESQRFFRLRKR